MEALEEDFQNLVKRLSVLRSLFERTSSGDTVDWTALARTIEADEGADELLWHRIGDVTAAPVGPPSSKASHERGMAVAKWHELIADTISLMSDHVAPDDSRTASIAQRYRQLEEAQAGSLDQMSSSRRT